MKKLAVLALAALAWHQGTSSARGPIGGGGARPVARPAVVHTPSFSNVGRPNNLAGGGAHPGMVPQQRPNINTFNRPNIGNNPNIVNNHPNIGNNPNIVNNHPNIGNQTGLINNRQNLNNANIGLANRQQIGNTNIGTHIGNTNIGVNNRPVVGNTANIGNRTNVVNNPTNVVNRPVNVNQTTVNKANVNANFNRGGNLVNGGRTWAGNRAGYNYYNGYHAGWRNNNWNRWNWSPWTWAGGAAALGWAGGAFGPTYVYSNPFYVAPTTVVQVPAVNYSQPIAVPVPVPQQQAVPAPGTDANDPAPEPEPQVPPEVDRLFTSARDSFKGGDYARALTLIDQAIAKLPSDAALHEFRGLTQFALKDYKAAAATVYAVLAAGPGWDWATVQGLYGDVADYTAQLRALETYQKANPEAADASFLLAYQYLVLNHPEAAARQLQNVIKLVPKDQLAPRLLQAIQPTEGNRPGPQP